MSQEKVVGGPIEGQVRVRFAPSPTGHLHVGGARTHLFSWLYARATGGTMVLRVEDTDRDRSRPEFEKMVLDDIKALDLQADEGPEEGGEYGPYRQFERLDLFKKYAYQLLDQEKAYRCFCTEEDLDKKAQAAKAQGKSPQYDGTCTHIPPEEAKKRADAGESFAVRLKAPYKDYVLNDYIRGKVTFKAGMVGDFIILRSNGIPVYNFAVIVDDYLMRISHVIRAEEHMPNTLRQMMCLDALGWEYPTFCHISLVLGSDRKKLSKRHGATSVNMYLEEGFLPEALVNFLALLGWSPPDGKEIRTREEIIKDFVLEKLTKSPAIFDTEKLRWMNGEYIKAMSVDELYPRIKPFVEKAGFDPDVNGEAWFKQVLAVVQTGLRQLNEIGPHLNMFYKDKFEFSDEAKTVLADDEAKAVAKAFGENLEATTELTQDSLNEIQKAVKTATGAKGKKLFMPIRASVTGMAHGPELHLSLPLIGKEEALRRIQLAVS